MYRDNQDRLDTVKKLRVAVRKLIAQLELDPKDFYSERTKILNYYKDHKWSPDYIKRINRMMNLWGAYSSKKTNGFFQPIPKLSNNQVQKIVELREDVEDVRTPAEPLIWNDLRNRKSTFENEDLLAQSNWLFIALWFGLRPSEVDNLKNEKYWQVKHYEEKNLDVLSVYQTKLTSLPKEKRWKLIPIYFEEQKEAFKLIEQGNFKRPLNKTLQRLFSSQIETYSPRKGFTDLMLERKFSLEDISTFLGHCDISTTWRHYKDKFTFKIPG